MTAQDLLAEVAKEFGVAKRRIKTPKRGGRAACEARDEFCRRMFANGYSLGDIARFLCGRTNDAIYLAVRRAEARVS
jgi:hypothetical protein